ncbi:chaperone modulator CbpM [Salinisphaera sp. T31B1]|uniref:chaperone modulator CbpM n=1 Tax=Salinisphaera sp. T31B1 TaxID=727963 RepID=UPI00333FB679
MANRDHTTVTCEIVETRSTLTLGQLCRSAGVQAEWITLLVEEGVIEPQQRGSRWEFAATHLPRVHTAARLHRDLGVNVSGLALALELMDEITALRARLDALAERG